MPITIIQHAIYATQPAVIEIRDNNNGTRTYTSRAAISDIDADTINAETQNFVGIWNRPDERPRPRKEFRG